jgi:hypothetical protein
LVPDRRKRAGFRDVRVSQALSHALEAEALALKTDDPVETIKNVNDFFAGLDVEVERVAKVRLEAVTRLREAGWPYGRIAAATGLSRQRVAELAREVNMGGRVSPPKASSGHSPTDR